MWVYHVRDSADSQGPESSAASFGKTGMTELKGNSDEIELSVQD